MKPALTKAFPAPKTKEANDKLLFLYGKKKVVVSREKLFFIYSGLVSAHERVEKLEDDLQEMRIALWKAVKEK